MPTTTRLIERWIPTKETSIEALREGGALAGHPPVNQLHVWWARRPLVFSRATIAAALLKADAGRSTFIEAIGSTDTVVAERHQMDTIKATGQWSNVAFSNARAFTHNLSPAEIQWFKENLATPDPIVLDVTAGGGAIPFEAGRLGLNTIANELNPVASLILRATCEWPQQHGNALHPEYEQVKTRFQNRVTQLMTGTYPEVQPLEPEDIPQGLSFEENPPQKFSRIVRHQRNVWAFLWCRTITCPSCQKEIPLSPNWKLNPKGAGIKLLPQKNEAICHFKVVNKTEDQSPGTVRGGIATCPYPDCGTTTRKGYIASEARAGHLGQRIYCVIYRDQFWKANKSGKEQKRPVTKRTFKAARPVDGDLDLVQTKLIQLSPKWDAADILPNEPFPEGNDNRPITYGMSPWRNMFSPRQQLAHGYCVQAFQEMVDQDRAAGQLTNLRQAAWCYIALGLDKLFPYNSLLTAWHPNREVLASVFANKDFSLKWSYAEMAVTIQGLGLDWALTSIADCLKAITKMAGHPSTEEAGYFDQQSISQVPLTAHEASGIATSSLQVATPATVINGDAQMLDLDDNSADAIIFDPPYHNNVNYAELSDFYYVWLKRTAGYVLQDGLFSNYLTDKVTEAIASPARFKNQIGSAKKLATADYQSKMDKIFTECHRVLKKEDGIMVIMFTHKSTEAWNAMTIGLIEAGFNITRTWPVKTESEYSLAIKDKAAARTTILLVCRPISQPRSPQAWHEVAQLIRNAVRTDIKELQQLELNIVDIYTAAYGTALRVVSENWGSTRATAHPDRPNNPFGVEPADALAIAREEVTAFRSEQLTNGNHDSFSDLLTRFYILSQDGMAASTMPFDEANLFARALGVEINDQATKRVIQVKSGNVTFKDAKTRMAEGIIGRNKAATNILDQVHTAIAIADQQDATAAKTWLEMNGYDWQDGSFRATLQALRQIHKPGHNDEPAIRALSTLLYSEQTYQNPLPESQA